MLGTRMSTKRAKARRPQAQSFPAPQKSPLPATPCRDGSASVVVHASTATAATGSGRRGALLDEVKEELRVGASRPWAGDTSGAECPVGLISHQRSTAFLLLAFLASLNVNQAAVHHRQQWAEFGLCIQG